MVMQSLVAELDPDPGCLIPWSCPPWKLPSPLPPGLGQFTLHLHRCMLWGGGGHRTQISFLHY